MGEGQKRSQSLVTLEGVLERITFVNEENGFCVIRIKVPQKAELVTAVGNMLGVQPGENLRLRGEWVFDKKFGEQFKVESYLTIQPSTLVGIEKYLGSGLVKGLGHVMASRLVKQFGLDTLDVIEKQPWRLTHVEGIGAKRKAMIICAWQEHKAIKDVMLFLQTHGVSPTFAVKICKRYGQQAIKIVKENPYRLAMDIYGIGFKSADQIALGMGIALDSPERVEAGVLHVLENCADEGHLFFPCELLVQQSQALLSAEESLVERAIEKLSADRQLILERHGDEKAVYLSALFYSEEGAKAQLEALLKADRQAFEVDVEGALDWIETKQGIQLASQQKQAIRKALQCKVLVITGGPGTGKTTIVNSIIQIYLKKEQRVLLTAPTGRAAKRLSETSGQTAKTIHRLLEYDPQHQSFNRNLENPLEGDLLVVDEVSMVDAVLFYHLLKALPRESQLILVGDVDQLPSVGPGCVLRDVIRSGVIEVVELSEIFRQAQESLIIVNAHRINRGELPETKSLREEADFFFIEREEPEAVLKTLKELLARRIPDRFGVDPLRDVQVLTPMHRGLLGSKNLNLELQALLNPRGESMVKGGKMFRVGDKVMQVRNNYSLETFNGDIGQVQRIDLEEQQLVVRIEEREVVYEASDIDELILGYACSIHKSQGSEYPVVVILLHTQHYLMLQRNLLYTAVTRGRKLVVVVGNRKALALAVKKHQVKSRYTYFAKRLSLAVENRQ